MNGGGAMQVVCMIAGGVLAVAIYGLGRWWRQRRDAVAITSADFPDESLDKIAEALMEPLQHWGYPRCTSDQVGPYPATMNAPSESAGDEHEEGFIG